MKRRLGDPGRPGEHAGARFIADRVDSGLGMLAAVSIVATPALTWLLVLLSGRRFTGRSACSCFTSGPRQARMNKSNGAPSNGSRR